MKSEKKASGSRLQALGIDDRRPTTPTGQAYLSYTGDGMRRIGGVGEFNKKLPALPVSTSIGRQYDTDEMRERGWVVKWVDENYTGTVPAPEESPSPAK